MNDTAVKTADRYLPVESAKPSSYSWVSDVDHFIETGGGFKTTKLAPLVIACHRHNTVMFAFQQKVTCGYNKVQHMLTLQRCDRVP